MWVWPLERGEWPAAAAAGRTHIIKSPLKAFCVLCVCGVVVVLLLVVWRVRHRRHHHRHRRMFWPLQNPPKEKNKARRREKTPPKKREESAFFVCVKRPLRWSAAVPKGRKDGARRAHTHTHAGAPPPGRRAVGAHTHTCRGTAVWPTGGRRRRRPAPPTVRACVCARAGRRGSVDRKKALPCRPSPPRARWQAVLSALRGGRRRRRAAVCEGRAGAVPPRGAHGCCAAAGGGGTRCVC